VLRRRRGTGPGLTRSPSRSRPGPQGVFSMATIYTHSFVGLVLGRVLTARRLPWPFWALAAVLPAIPDLDVFSSAAYGSLLGPRGFTHSLAFAAAIGLLTAALTFRYFRV